MTEHIASALFDLDGVLIDTEGTYTDIWTDIEAAHPTGIENFAIKIKGNTLRKILDTYYPDADEQAAICHTLREREEAMQYRLFDGVEAFLEQLHHAHIPTAIVTSSNAPKMERLFGQLEGLRELFDTVVTDADVSHSKPHPECYLMAAERLGADIRSSIVFEDSFSGMEAGRAAGAFVVGLATTNPWDAMAGKADFLARSMSEITLETILNKFKNHAPE